MEQLNKEIIAKCRDVSIHKILGKVNNGRNLSIRCPFHSERSPSCVIYPTNDWHCFGCGSHGKGAIDFMLALGGTWDESINELSKMI